MNKIKLITFLALYSFLPSAFAQIGHKGTEILNIQAESSNRQGYENIIYIKQSGSWSKTECNTAYSYYNSKENPHFTAILLAAKLANKPVSVNVDDTYPKLGSFCQIINILL